MQLRAQVVGEDSWVEFCLADIVVAYEGDDVLYVRGCGEEVAVVYSSAQLVVDKGALSAFVNICKERPTEIALTYWPKMWRAMNSTEEVKQV